MRDYALEVNLWLDVSLTDKTIAPEAFEREWADLRREVERLVRKHTCANVTECELIEAYQQ